LSLSSPILIFFFPFVLISFNLSARISFYGQCTILRYFVENFDSEISRGSSHCSKCLIFCVTYFLYFPKLTNEIWNVQQDIFGHIKWRISTEKTKSLTKIREFFGKKFRKKYVVKISHYFA
jgi:hypothetical protein